jgi:hypothetical protein
MTTVHGRFEPKKPGQRAQSHVKWRLVFEHPHLHVSVKLEALRTYLLPVVTHGMEVWAPPVPGQRGSMMRLPQPLSPVQRLEGHALRRLYTICGPAAVVGLGKIGRVRPQLSYAATRPCYPWLLRMTWHTSGCCERWCAVSTAQTMPSSATPS